MMTLKHLFILILVPSLSIILYFLPSELSPTVWSNPFPLPKQPAVNSFLNKHILLGENILTAPGLRHNHYCVLLFFVSLEPFKIKTFKEII